MPVAVPVTVPVAVPVVMPVVMPVVISVAVPVGIGPSVFRSMLMMPAAFLLALMMRSWSSLGKLENIGLDVMRLRGATSKSCKLKGVSFKTTALTEGHFESAVMLAMYTSRS